MKVRCSSGSFEGFSAVKNAIRLVSSSTTTTISLPENPARVKSCVTLDRSNSEFRMLASEYEVATTPSGSSDAAVARIPLRLRSTPATMMCLDVSSQAHNGTFALKTSVIFSASPLLNECDLVNVFQCRDAGKYFLERRIAKKSHAFIVRRAFDFRCRPFFGDHFANVIGKIEQLLDGGPAAITRTIAIQATLSFIEGEIPVLFRF